MNSILFVCHGNICRSPMAEFIMKKLVADRGISEKYFIASAATSQEEIGNDIYLPAKSELKRNGIPYAPRQAVQVQKSDYEKYDLFLVMDNNNLANIMRIFKEDPKNKVYKLLEFANSTANVADPWYTGDFQKAYDDISKGCSALIDQLENKANS